jgi:nicotinate-nucleotide adenylyltransferase
MVAAAFGGEPHTEISRIELDRPGPSYTVDTLEELAADGDELFLVLGADQYRALPRWNGADRIRALATIVVAGRPGHAATVGDAVPLGSPLVDISSSELRRRIAAGEPVRHLIPAAALELALAAAGAA